MHPAALAYVQQWTTPAEISVLDLGGRDVNGSCRPVFPNADYRTLDVLPHASVDIVANAAYWEPTRTFDVVVCTEVFEHTDEWRGICRTAFRALRPAGRLIVTCAGPARASHSAIDGGALQAGEFYGNVEAGDLGGWLVRLGFHGVECADIGEDVQATGLR